MMEIPNSLGRQVERVRLPNGGEHGDQDDTNYQNTHVIQDDRGGSKYVDADHIGGNGDHFVYNIEMFS